MRAPAFAAGVYVRRGAVLRAAAPPAPRMLPNHHKVVRARRDVPLRATDSVGAGRRASQQAHRHAAARVSAAGGRGVRCSMLSFRAAAVLLTLAAAVSMRT